MAPARLILTGALAAGIVVASATSAGAATNACDVRVGNHRFVNGSHVSVPSNRQAPIAVSALEEKPRYRVELEVAGQRGTVGTGRGIDFGWHRNVDVPSYARFGVGTYRLHVITTVDGEPCAVTGLMDISGRAPITTVAGGTSLLIAIVGAIGLLWVFSRRGGRALRTRHQFGVDDPIGEFVAITTPGNYVGWAEVACDQSARTFVTNKPDSAAMREFLGREATRTRLSELGDRGVRVRPKDGVVLARMSWRPRAFLFTPLLGVFTSLAIVAYLQQAAVLYPSLATVAVTVVVGLVAGLVMSNIARLFAARSLNRRMKAAEASLDVEDVEPLYPPIDHLDHLDQFVWTPTHTIPDDGKGLPAWEQADRADESVAILDPGLPVRVVEQRDGLAQVVCSNGWVGWTDAEKLEAIDS